MKTHRLTEAYTVAFNAFLEYTSEKKDLLTVLKRRIMTAGGHSLLDIGAGNGDLAIPLSELVDEYVAIEPKPDFALRLHQKGINVIRGAFPLATHRAFDLVLASHVVPWEEGESEAFFHAVWKCLNPQGAFMMITYDEERSAWGELLEKSGLPVATVGQGHLEGYKRLLASWGTLEVETITTHVETERFYDLNLALSFVYGDGQPERAKKFRGNLIVREILETHYQQGGRYRFPFIHYLLQVRKEGEAIK